MIRLRCTPSEPMAMGSRPREAASLLKEAFRLQIVASAEKLQPVEIYQRPIATPSEVITPKHLTTTETLEPMMQELRTYIHRELSDLKGDMVRQFCEQERIIQEQQEEIERLLKRLNQGGYACLLRLILFRGNNRIETQHQKMLSTAASVSAKRVAQNAIRAFSSYSPIDGEACFPHILLGVVDPEWVQKRMDHLRILDATLILDPTRDAAKEFTQVGESVRPHLSRSTFLERSSLT